MRGLVDEGAIRSVMSDRFSVWKEVSFVAQNMLISLKNAQVVAIFTYI